MSDGNATLKPGTSITVRLLKAPRPDVEYPAEVQQDDGEHIVARRALVR